MILTTIETITRLRTIEGVRTPVPTKMRPFKIKCKSSSSLHRPRQPCLETEACNRATVNTVLLATLCLRMTPLTVRWARGWTWMNWLDSKCRIRRESNKTMAWFNLENLPKIIIIKELIRREVKTEATITEAIPRGMARTSRWNKTSPVTMETTASRWASWASIISSNSNFRCRTSNSGISKEIWLANSMGTGQVVKEGATRDIILPLGKVPTASPSASMRTS